MMMPMMQFIGNLGYVAVCILGGFLAARGRLAVGDIQAFIQYVRSFTQPLAQLAQISNVLQQTAASAERVFEFLAELIGAPVAASVTVPSIVPPSASPKSMPLVVAPTVTATPVPGVTVHGPPTHGRSSYSSSRYPWVFHVRR